MEIKNIGVCFYAFIDCCFLWTLQVCGVNLGRLHDDKVWAMFLIFNKITVQLVPASHPTAPGHGDYSSMLANSWLAAWLKLAGMGTLILTQVPSLVSRRGGKTREGRGAGPFLMTPPGGVQPPGCKKTARWKKSAGLGIEMW